MNSIICTIAIPVYNRVDLIGRCVLSAMQQADERFEIVIVDNASTDGTWEYLFSLDIPRIRIFRNSSNIGIFGNFNRCLQESNGQFIRFLCSDDVLAPGCLDREIQIMEGHPDAAMLSGGQLTLGYDDLGNIGSNSISNDYELLSGEHAVRLWFELFCNNRLNYFSYPSGILFRSSACRAAGGFDISYDSVGDIDFYFRVLDFGGLVLYNGLSCYVMSHAGQLQRRTLADGVELGENFRVLDLSRAVVGKSYYFYKSRLRSICILAAIRYFCRCQFIYFKNNYLVYVNHGPVCLMLDLYGACSIALSRLLRYFGFGLLGPARDRHLVRVRRV